MQANNGNIITTIIVCAILLGGLIFIIQPEAVDVPTASEIAALISVPAVPVAPAIVPETNQSTFPDYMLDKDAYEEELQEDEAEKLVMAELNSKDFRLELLKAIDTANDVGIGVDTEQEGLKIDSYRDFEDVYAVDVDEVEVDDEDAEVTVIFKVQYILDDDEDLIGKARVTVIYGVEELVVDDDFEDAETIEIDEIDFTVNHIYSNLL